MDHHQRLKPLTLGLGFLALSFVFALLIPQTDSQEGSAIVAWFENATLWIGVVCVAGALFTLMLRYRDQDRTPRSD